MELLTPLLNVYENVKGCSERTKDSSGNYTRPAIEAVVDDVHALGYNMVS